MRELQEEERVEQAGAATLKPGNRKSKLATAAAATDSVLEKVNASSRAIPWHQHNTSSNQSKMEDFYMGALSQQVFNFPYKSLNQHLHPITRTSLYPHTLQYHS